MLLAGEEPTLSQGNARPLWACVLHVSRRRRALAWLLLSAGPRTGLGRASHAETILAESSLASSGGHTRGPCAEEARGGPCAAGTQGRLGREADRAPESPLQGRREHLQERRHAPDGSEPVVPTWRGGPAHLSRGCHTKEHGLWTHRLRQSRYRRGGTSPPR